MTAVTSFFLAAGVLAAGFPDLSVLIRIERIHAVGPPGLHSGPVRAREAESAGSVDRAAMNSCVAVTEYCSDLVGLSEEARWIPEQVIHSYLFDRAMDDR